jgi:hypothetical protein
VRLIFFQEAFVLMHFRVMLIFSLSLKVQLKHVPCNIEVMPLTGIPSIYHVVERVEPSLNDDVSLVQEQDPLAHYVLIVYLFSGQCLLPRDLTIV